ncbi:F4 family fimbrial subunit [Vibrio panuliri]|uniref:Fimbrial protein n=1 Tax=Vibrio panuliri TaxID=1381081 RepID=A0ABX3F4Z4_9VIBR|nr:hypothetical protein [Vibrio panuliri]KAB1457263.1 hypothetical protein F7O85_05840 [Vibrio panuliri]OLQ84738.1 hypothetical protein BIY20_17115 [Vibrio panuliri]
MKKTLIALSMLTALVSANQALAAFSDAPANGDLTITGTLTNINPKWLWQIPDATKAKVSNIVTYKITAIPNGENSEFEVLKGETLDFLQGYTKTASVAGGGAGMTPVVTIAGTKWNEDNSASPRSVTVTTTTGTGESATTANTGTMTFDVTQGVSIALRYADLTGSGFKSIVYDGVSAPVSVPILLTAAQIMRNNVKHFSAVYTNEDTSAGSNFFQNDILRFLRGDIGKADIGRNSFVSAGYASKINNFKLVFPTASVPTSWNATIPVTISMK